MITIVETDGCCADGIAVATNCWVGHRTLRIEDYGKVAATFVDTRDNHAVRIHPRPGARALAQRCAPEASSRWEAYLLGYQRAQVDELFAITPVKLRRSVAQIISMPDKLAICQTCGEEIINEREVICQGRVQCRACTGQSYYAVI